MLVISSYPPYGSTHHRSIVGGASYTKNTLVSLLKFAKLSKKSVPKITVLAEKLNGETTHSEDGIFVKRIWKRNSLFTYLILLKEIIASNTNIVVIEFELAMFGQGIYIAFLPLFLLILKLLRKQTFFVFHQVLIDVDEIAGHINIKEKSIKTLVLNIAIQSLYIAILRMVTKAIVFEEFLKEELSRFISEEKVLVIPHLVEEINNSQTESDARKELKIPKNKFVLLYFGFLAWYKGTDALISLFSTLPQSIKENCTLIIAGGPNPNHLDKKYYVDYIEKVKKDCKDKSIIFTDFVLEEKIPLYFKAADAVVLPYRTFMSSSGPLSLAFTFEKSILLSDKLKGYKKTSDIKNALTMCDLTINDLTFELNKTDFERTVVQSEKNQKQIIAFSRIMKRERRANVIASLYYNLLFGKNNG